MPAINTKDDGDYGYIAFYRGKKVEVYAKSSYTAMVVAAKHFKAKKEREVTVVVCENPDGTPVVHTPTD